MNVADAGVFMRCHRRGKRADSQIENAARLAESDVVLQRELTAQREFDDRMVSLIRCIQPPEDLRKKLAELGGAARPAGGSLFKHPAMLPAICGVLVLVGIAVFFQMERMRNFPGREAVGEMIAQTKKVDPADFEPVASPAGQLGDWFYMRGFEGYALPAEIGPLQAAFARVLKADGHATAQIAVERHQLLVHVFRAADFGVEIPADEPWRIFEHEGWAAALRRAGGNCVLLTFRGSQPEMEEFVQSLNK